MNRGEGNVAVDNVDTEGDLKITQSFVSQDPPQDPDLDGKDPTEKFREELDKEFMKPYADVDLSMIVSGYVTHTVEVIPNFKVELRTLREEEDLEVSKIVSDKFAEFKGTAHYVNENTSRYILARAIIKINGNDFGSDNNDRFEKIGKFAKVIKVALWEEWENLNRAVTIMMRGHSGNSLERRLIGLA